VRARDDRAISLRARARLSLAVFPSPLFSDEIYDEFPAGSVIATTLAGNASTPNNTARQSRESRDAMCGRAFYFFISTASIPPRWRTTTDRSSLDARVTRNFPREIFRGPFPPFISLVKRTTGESPSTSLQPPRAPSSAASVTSLREHSPRISRGRRIASNGRVCCSGRPFIGANLLPCRTHEGKGLRLHPTVSMRERVAAWQVGEALACSCHANNEHRSFVPIV